MTKPTKKQIVGAIGAAAVSAFFSAGLARSIYQHGLGSSDAAGWMQAIGSIVGLGIAIWAPLNQARQAAASETVRRHSAMLRVCGVIKDELSLLEASYDSTIFRELLRDAPDEYFNIHMPAAANPHPVFNAVVGQIADIDSSDVRRSIIEAYAAAEHLDEMLTLNTDYLHQYRRIFEENRSRSEQAFGWSESIAKEANAKGRLLSLRKQLRESAQILVANTRQAIEALDAMMD